MDIRTTPPGQTTAAEGRQHPATRASAPPAAPPVPPRVLLIVPAGFALLAGLDAALLLLGLPAPVELSRLAQLHGLLLVLGFLGTLIALERAVALRHPLGYLAPAALGLGAVLAVVPVPTQAAGAAWIAGTAGVCLIYTRLHRRRPSGDVAVQATGAVLALGAALMWTAGAAIPTLVPWLAGFIVLTIAGERVELARLAMPARAEQVAVWLAAAVAATAGAALLWPGVGAVGFGAALLTLTLWLVRYDIARTTVRGRGLPRYAAACMLAGYAWLALAAGLWLLGGPVTEGPGYDAVVHAVFLGFGMSMVLAHAPIILPAIARRPLPYHPVMAVPALLLHGSLLLRVAVGDLHQVPWAWQGGGVLNVVALLGFVAVVLVSAVRR